MADHATETQAPAPAGMPVKLLVMAAVVALVVGVGGAAVFFQFVMKPGGAADSSITAPPAGTGGATDAAAPATARPEAIVPLEPFIVNLADQPEIRYLKLGVSLAISSPEAETQIQARSAPIRDTILVLLSSKESMEIRSPEGKLRLREEITKRINAVTSRPLVKNTYFTEFVVQ